MDGQETAAPLRFAHPFFGAGPIETREGVAPFGNRMLDHIIERLDEVPPTRADGRLELADVIGAEGQAQIAAAGQIIIHAVGDTGEGDHSPQSDVADAMTRDYDTAHPERSPAFFLHLGDVIYGPGKEARYRDQFYTPYRHYPGKIVAIAGNHDGETGPDDPKTLAAFLANFADPKPHVPSVAGSVFRETMPLPGVYWAMDTPFAQIVGLYSNSAENPGFISGGKAGDTQKKWLVDTLKALRNQRDAGARKALVFATHHPPFSSGGHSGSHDMLLDIDGACTEAGIWPDLFLSGHSHNYQRYTRTVPVDGGRMEVPFVVTGCGGHGNGHVDPANGQTLGDHRFERSYKGYGYLRATVSPHSIITEFFAVDGTSVTRFDRCTVDLATSTVHDG